MKHKTYMKHKTVLVGESEVNGSRRHAMKIIRHIKVVDKMCINIASCGEIIFCLAHAGSSLVQVI